MFIKMDAMNLKNGIDSGSTIEYIQYYGVSNGWYVYYSSDMALNTADKSGQIPFSTTYFDVSYGSGNSSVIVKAKQAGNFLVINCIDKTFEIISASANDELWSIPVSTRSKWCMAIALN